MNELHQEIDLYDRKISYCQTLEKFDTEEQRATARQKLESKRARLVKQALNMATHGTECDAKFLPRSFKAEAAAAATGEQG